MMSHGILNAIKEYANAVKAKLKECTFEVTFYYGIFKDLVDFQRSVFFRNLHLDVQQSPDLATV
jgi:hypothetical protein